MKLLFDENLSPRLVRLVAVGYPGSVHVRDVGLKGHVDDALWQFARGSGLVIVSKDTDFRERSYVEGFPAKSHLARRWKRRHGCRRSIADGRT